jgi:hypothetical protein
LGRQTVASFSAGKTTVDEHARRRRGEDGTVAPTARG